MTLKLSLMIDLFFPVEERNFALFNYVNELNSQCEMYQEQISEIRRDVQRYEEQGIELEEQRRHMLERMEEKQAQVIAAAKEYEEKNRGTKKILDQCRAGLHLEIVINES